MDSICSVGPVLDDIFFFRDSRDAVKASKWLFKESEIDDHPVYESILEFYKDRLEELISEIDYQREYLNKTDKEISELLNDKLELEDLIKNEG